MFFPQDALDGNCFPPLSWVKVFFLVLFVFSLSLSHPPPPPPPSHTLQTSWIGEWRCSRTGTNDVASVLLSQFSSDHWGEGIYYVAWEHLRGKHSEVRFFTFPYQPLQHKDTHFCEKQDLDKEVYWFGISVQDYWHPRQVKPNLKWTFWDFFKKWIHVPWTPGSLAWIFFHIHAAEQNIVPLDQWYIDNHITFWGQKSGTYFVLNYPIWSFDQQGELWGRLATDLGSDWPQRQEAREIMWPRVGGCGHPVAHGSEPVILLQSGRDGVNTSFQSTSIGSEQ